MTKQERIDAAKAAYLDACAAEGRARGAFDVACEFGTSHGDRGAHYHAYSAASATRCAARLTLTAAIHDQEG